MLECNRYIHRKLAAFSRGALLLLPLILVILLLTQVVFAENVYVIKDGGQTLVHTSHATDPADVLEEAGLILGADDTYTAETGPGVLEITIQRNKNVEVFCDGAHISVKTYARDVQQLLQELDIALGGQDATDVALSDELTDGMQIRVLRCTVKEEGYTVGLPMATLYYYDENLKPGEEVVIRKGHTGRVEYLDRVTRLGDTEIRRDNLRETLLCQSVDRIVITGDPDIAATGTELKDIWELVKIIAPEYSVDSGLPYIGNGLIVATDGEAFYYSDELVVKATAYNNADPGCTIYTAIGTLCRVGAIAVDPKVIPYGTRMFILTNDGKYVYGEAVAEDCGGYIKGNRIDLYFDTVEECSKFGVRQATVYFLDGFTLG